MDHVTDNDDLISDRTRRFLLTFALDECNEVDDDEFVITSAGKVVGLKDIQRSVPKQKEKVTDGAKSSRRLWNYLCSGNPMDASETLVDRFLCTPISCYASNTSPSYHALVAITLACVLVVFKQLCLHGRKLKSNGLCSSQSNESAVVPKVVKEIRLQPRPSLPTETDSSKRTDDLADAGSTEVPGLVAAESLPNDRMLLRRQHSATMILNDIRPEVATVAPRSSDHMKSNQTVISIPSPIKTTIADARHALALVSLYEQACSEQGRVCDHGAALQWAALQQKSEMMLNVRREEELRRYLWDNAQRTVDRSLSQNQHDETIAVSREDKDWQRKLQTSRDKCHSAVVCAFYQSLVGTFLVVVLRPIIQVMYLWSTLSGPEILCYGTDTSLDRKNVWSTSLSWYGRYTSYAYADSWTRVMLGEAATCLAYAIGRAFHIFAAGVSLNLASWLLKQLVTVEPVQNLIKSAVLLFILSICGWVPEHLLYRVLCCLGVIASTCYVLVEFKFHRVRTQFRGMNTPPHASVVNNCLEWFDDAIRMIQIIPVILAGGLVFVVFSG
jgi:hypothetical protein